MTGAMRHQEHPAQPLRLRLPDISDSDVPGVTIVQRAMSLTLGVFSALLIVVIVVSLFARATDTVNAEGVLEPFVVRDVRAPQAGLITRVLVRTGERVKAGQVVALLDPSEAESRIADLTAEAASLASDIRRLTMSVTHERKRTLSAITQAEAGVSKARVNLLQRMADFGVFGDVDSVARSQRSRTHIGLDGPSTDLQLARTGLDLAIADSSAIRLAEAELDQKKIDARRVSEHLVDARRRLDSQRLRAPAPGIVLTEGIELLVGSMIGAGQSVLEVGDVRRWCAALAVSEREVRRVLLGDSVTIEIPALAELEDNRFTGRVIQVDPQPLGLEPGVRGTKGQGYRVVVALNPGEVDSVQTHLFRRGYGVHAKIAGERGRMIAMAIRHLRAQLRRVR